MTGLIRRLRAFLGASVLLLAVGLGAHPAHAQPTDVSSFPFLRFEPSARAAALSGAFPVTDDEDVNTLFYNPAGLSASHDGAGALSYLNHLSDINAGFLAYGHTVEGLATFGGGVRFLSWGAFEGANEFGERTGSFGAGDAALTVGAARELGPRWRYGASLHAIYSRLAAARAAAVGLDLGVLYRIPSQQMTLNASVNRLGQTLDSFGPARDRLPTDVRLGLTKRLRYLPFLLSVTAYDLHHLGDGLPDGTTLDRVLAHLLLGGELTLQNAVQLRVGYHHRRSKELDRSDGFDAAGLSAGFGIAIAPLHVSYAYQSWSSFGGLHWLTLRAQL
jgi:hypothetical protein